VKFVFETYEPDAVMIGQAAMLNPFIFRQAKFFMENGFHQEDPDITERIDMCLAQLKLAIDLKGEQLAVREFRKYYSGFFNNLRNINSFRLELMRYENFSEIEEKLLWFRENSELIIGEKSKQLN